MIIVPLVHNLLVLTQKDVTEEDIDALEYVELNFEYTRQSGKTTSLVHVVEIVMIYVSRLFDIPLDIGIFAPQKEQANTDFKRLKNALSKSKQDLSIRDHDANRKAKEESNAKTITLGNGSSCYIFPVTPTSNPESKTLHLIIVEEAQDIDDKIINEQILPMGSATNAVVIRVGTAGGRHCDFYWAIQKGRAYVMTFPEIAADRRRMYELTGDATHLIYERNINNLIAEKGLMSPAIQRPYFNVWQLQAGMFITAPELFRLRIDRTFDDPKADPVYREYHQWYHSGRHILPEIDEWATSHNVPPPLLKLYREWTEANHYFGLDTAKKQDQTVLKIGRETDGRLAAVRSVQGLRGTNYSDQFEILKSELQWFKIAAGAIDSTGQGDFMPDLFERGTGYQIYRVTFSLLSKDIMYKSLYNKAVNNQIAYYWQDPEKYQVKTLSDWAQLSPEQYTAKASEEFEDEFIKLEKTWKGDKMSVHHPEKTTDGSDPHDDHPDGYTLMNFAYDSYNKGSGITDYYQQKNADERARMQAIAEVNKGA